MFFKNQNFWLILFLVVIISLWIGNIFFIPKLYPNVAERGQFGDMFGGLNALFSGLAFWGILFAIFLQREDLKLQREDLQLQREELKRSAAALERQLLTMNENLEITKERVKAKKKRIKPKYRLALQGIFNNHSDYEAVHSLTVFYNPESCNEMYALPISGYTYFHCEIAKSNNEPCLLIDAKIIKNNCLRFKLEYEDIEENRYQDVVEYNPEYGTFYDVH